jgi:hypothetical protein
VSRSSSTVAAARNGAGSRWGWSSWVGRTMAADYREMAAIVRCHGKITQDHKIA